MIKFILAAVLCICASSSPAPMDKEPAKERSHALLGNRSSREKHSARTWRDSTNERPFRNAKVEGSSPIEPLNKSLKESAGNNSEGETAGSDLEKLSAEKKPAENDSKIESDSNDLKRESTRIELERENTESDLKQESPASDLKEEFDTNNSKDELDTIDSKEEFDTNEDSEYEYESQPDNTYSQKECSISKLILEICMKEGTNRVFTSCRSINCQCNFDYHSSCLQRWHQITQTCPFGKTRILDTDEFYLSQDFMVVEFPGFIAKIVVYVDKFGSNVITRLPIQNTSSRGFRWNTQKIKVGFIHLGIHQELFEAVAKSKMYSIEIEFGLSTKFRINVTPQYDGTTETLAFSQITNARKPKLSVFYPNDSELETFRYPTDNFSPFQLDSFYYNRVSVIQIVTTREIVDLEIRDFRITAISPRKNAQFRGVVGANEVIQHISSSIIKGPQVHKRVATSTREIKVELGPGFMNYALLKLDASGLLILHGESRSILLDYMDNTITRTYKTELAMFDHRDSLLETRELKVSPGLGMNLVNCT